MTTGRRVVDRIDTLADWPTTPDARYLLATGATTGATSQAQTFANGISAPVWYTTATAQRYYRNVLAYSYTGGSITGTLVIVLPKLKSASHVSMTIRGFNYTANNSADWQLNISFYNFSTGFFGKAAQQEGSGAPFRSVRFGNNGTNDVILIGATSTVWNYPCIHITDVSASFNAVTGWETGWSASIVSSESGITVESSVNIEYAGKNVFPTIASSVPASTDVTFNSYYVVAGQQYARFGVVDGGGGIPTRATYIQGGFTGSALYYNLALNPLGGSVGIGTVTPTRPLDVVTTVTPTTVGNAISVSISSSSPSAGDGVGIRAGLKSTTTSDQDAGRLTWQWDVATHASRASRGKLSAYYTSTERVCIDWKADSSAPYIGFLGATPVARPTAYTQTYSTAARTIAAYTTDAESAAYTGIDNAQAGTVYAQLTDVNALRVAYENLRASYDGLIQVVNSIIDDVQAYGLFA